MAAVDKVNAMLDDIQQGKGNAGKLLKDEKLYASLNQTAENVRQLTQDINSGKGALGKFAKDEEFARKLQDTVDKLSAISDRLAAGEGSAGMFLKDPALYKNTDALLVETRDLIKAVRQDPKKYLTIHLKLF